MDAIKVSLHEGDKESLLQALQQVPHAPDIVKQLADEGISLVQEVCKLGFVDVLEYLIAQGVELSNEKGKETPLQTACRHNQSNIVEFLLLRGEPILPEGVQVWQEESPFYIASKYGHLEIVNFLLGHSPSLVSNEDARMSLLYAACQGGTVDIIKRWINPGMDINQPLRHIESFTDCEKKTPLFAACSAGHRHVVEFLVENYPELEFTGVICNTFPDVIRDTIMNFFIEVPSLSKHDEVDLFPFCKGQLNHRNLHVLHASWFDQFYPTLVELDISDNFLTELPDCLPWKLQNLQIFKAAGNNLKHLNGPLTADSDEICPRLERVNLMNNQLESVCPELFQLESLKELNLSNNKLEFLFRSRHQIAEYQLDRGSTLNRQTLVQKGWSCVKLTHLNVSHNMLKMIPAEISACTKLVTLIANNNNLTYFPTPWDCPLYRLDLSHNELERFPPSAEMFWCGTLKYLDISHNQLIEINETVVKLNVLVDLDASHNRIELFPPPVVWELSHLTTLNLKHNRLGAGSEIKSKPLIPLGVRSRTSVITEGFQLLFPMILAGCLKELKLSHNNLRHVPTSISELKSLEILNLSHNPIKTLPKELGRLKNCGSLKLEGCPLSSFDTSDSRKTKEILSSLLEQLRECKPYFKMKMVVIGKKDKGKTTLVNLLAGKKSRGVQNRSGIHREEITIKRRKQSVNFLSPFGGRNDIKFSVWDIEGSEEYTLIHHSVFTQYSLYLLVWDFWSIEKELNDIGCWLYNIQASCKSFRVILVGTFLDKMDITPEAKNEEIAKLEHLIQIKIPQARESLQLCPVSCINSEGIDQLNNVIYDTACSMKLPGKNGQYLIGRKFPKSYFLIEQLIADDLKFRMSKQLPPFLTKCQFSELIDKLPVKENDIDSVEEEQAVTKFLVETGSLLHYSDQLGALNTLYFLDPAWLCDILVKVFTAPYGKFLLTQGKGKVNRNEVIRLYTEDDRFPSFLNDQYIKLLERFEIAVPVNNSQMLFFPSKLPDNPPLDIEPTPPRNMKKVCRLYRMAELPSGFWTRLLSRMMTRVEQFSKNEWFYGPVMKQSVRHGSSKKKRVNGSYEDIHKGKSFRGLQITNAQSSFCREWLKVQYDEGSFCIEPVIFGTHVTDRSLPKGVLITEKSTKEDFAIMGIIIDEIEDIIQDFYPGLLELDDMTMVQRLQRYAICPSCYQQKIPPKDLNHFSMEYCARMLMAGETIHCPRGIKHYLNDLIPDMLLKEIPPKFFLDIKQLQFEENQENFLGGGVTGSVFKGKYGDLDIAIKLYRSDIRNKREDVLFSKSTRKTDSSDSGTETMSSKGSIGGDTPGGEDVYENFTIRGIDVDETESIKAFRALREMRQEVALTSRLKHPCIVSLVGILFSPKLLMALELAPLGSYRSLIDKHLNCRQEISRYRDKDKLNPPLFSKEHTFKFLHQIAKGLEYLHCNGIIYKDLKSDNILVMSENLEASVNLKLSDYGISKFCWSGGTVGLVGTPGYQAPEILDGLPYDEKVDIFSYAMMIYETVTGRRPYQEFDNMSQISKAIKMEDKRPCIKDFYIHSQFPYLESLMEQCWHKDAKERPAATDIVNKRSMQSIQFVALASVRTDIQRINKDCIVGAPSHDPGHTTVWLWEGEMSDRRLTILDLETSRPRQVLGFEGLEVVCMARVGPDVWVGSEDMVDIYGKDKTSGKLKRLDTISLDGCPVQMEVIVGDQIRRVPNLDVYIALNNAKICLYQTETSKKDPGVRRGNVRTTPGFKAPKVITLRSKKLFCMAFTKNNEELWVGQNHSIDIIDVRNFKVDTSKNINLRILNKSCHLDSRLNVSQMVHSSGRVWCLLKNTPLIFEFCEESYNCLSILTCEEDILLKTTVRQSLDFDEFTHTTYHTMQRWDSSSGSETMENEYENGYVAPTSASSKCNSIPDDDIYHELNGNRTIEEHAPRRRLATARKVLTQSVDSRVSKDSAPPVPERSNPPPIPRRTTITGPPRSGQADAPPVPERINAPPVPDRVQMRASTLPNMSKLGLFTKQRPNSGPELPPRSPMGRPSVLYERESNVAFNVVIQSLEIVGDSVWISRSNGDICVIDTRIPTAGQSDCGKVVAVFENKMRKISAQSEEEVKLQKAGKYVIATYSVTGSDIRGSRTEIAIWDALDVEDIERIQSYWDKIIYIENKIADETKKVSVNLGPV